MADKISAPIKQYPKEKGTPGPPPPRQELSLSAFASKRGYNLEEFSGDEKLIATNFGDALQP